MSLSDLIKQALSKTIIDPPDRYVENLILQFSTSSDKCLFFNEHGFIAGMVIDQHILFPGVRLALEVSWWVDPEYRGKMVGGRLYKQFEKWARDNNCIHIFQGKKSRDSRKFSEIYIKDLI